MIASRRFAVIILALVLAAFPYSAIAETSASQPSSQSNATPVPLKTVSLRKPMRVEVPQGEPIFVYLDQALDSGNAQADDKFTFTVAKPILISDYIVVPLGAHGAGHIDSANKAKWMGRPGSLIVSFDWVTSADGKRLRLVNSVGQVGDSNLDTSGGVDIGTAVLTTAAIQTGAIAASSVLSAAVPFAGFASLAVKGKNVHVGTNVPLRAYVARTAHVFAHEKAVGLPTSSEYDQ